MKYLALLETNNLVNKTTNDVEIFYNDKQFQNYANDYKTSSIRDWLNNDFYNTAFNASEQDMILVSTLDNNSWNEDTYLSTDDKIFLPSWAEMINTDYGFLENSHSKDANRCAKGTDYAKIQGLVSLSSNNNEGNTFWRLRTPGWKSNLSCYISSDGVLSDYSCNVNFVDFGIRPALRLNSATLSGDSQPTDPKKPFSKNTYMADVWLNQLEDRPDGYATGESHWLTVLFDKNGMNQSMSEVIFTSNQEDKWFTGAVGIWEGMEYVFKPETSIADGVYFDAKNRYMSMLFDLISYALNNKSMQDSFVAQAKEVSSSLKNALATPFTVGQQVYTMSNYTELKQAAKENKKEFSDWVKTQFSEESKSNKFFSKFNDIGSGILEIMDVCAIADDFYTRMTAYMLAASMTESLWNALEMIGQNTDSADLQTAANYLAAVAREANLANIVAYTDIEFCADISRFMSDKCIGALFDKAPIYGVWRKVYDAGTTVVNLMLNTQNIIDKYYLCKAASELFSASGIQPAWRTIPRRLTVPELLPVPTAILKWQ